MVRTQILKAINKVNQAVLLKGWVQTRRDHGRLTFLDLRDASGVVQVVVNPTLSSKAHETAKKLGNEFVVEIQGKVKKRPEDLVNPNLATGTIEIEASEIRIINSSKEPPFPIEGDGYEINEELRLKYRYLDLRRQRLSKNLHLRHKIIKHIRNFLDERGFIEIETPVLTKATPEGARDFLVPSRLQAGKFYALPQSPQQYKQLLMVAGYERYYQIARCFRDEDSRADRAYGEFTQLDLEMSFVTQDEILDLTEKLMIELAEKVAGKQILYKPFPRFTHQEALQFFGEDKFDLRKYQWDGNRWLPINPQLSTLNPQQLAFAWVVDFPLFEQTKTRELAPSHHPFTAPKDEDIPLLNSDPIKVRSWQHDLVCNGLEVGGGSLRITNPAIQKRIFEILGHNQEEIETKFGHLLKAFEFGVPPHSGIAPGIERLLMVLANEPNTREVTAFPMTAGGQTSVMEAPSAVEANQLKELGLCFLLE